MPRKKQSPELKRLKHEYKLALKRERTRQEQAMRDIQGPPRKKRNPRRGSGTKVERAVKAKKASAKRRVALALAKYLKQANPGMKAAAVRVQKLKGGVIKITPVKVVRRAR